MNETTRVRIPTTLGKRVKIYAAWNDLTLQAVAIQAFEEFLKKHPHPGPPLRLRPGRDLRKARRLRLKRGGTTTRVPMLGWST
jgi:hypothetical protein